jgi:hypothetical protein
MRGGSANTRPFEGRALPPEIMCGPTAPVRFLPPGRFGNVAPDPEHEQRRQDADQIQVAPSAGTGRPDGHPNGGGKNASDRISALQKRATLAARLVRPKLSRDRRPRRRSSMLLATSSQTAARSRSSCFTKVSSVFSASCRYMVACCQPILGVAFCAVTLSSCHRSTIGDCNHGKLRHACLTVVTIKNAQANGSCCRRAV